jgi:hypothetical protein
MLTGVARLSFRNNEQNAIRKRQGSRRKQSLWRLSARVLTKEGQLSPRAAFTKVPVMAGPAQLGWVSMSRCICDRKGEENEGTWQAGTRCDGRWRS